LGTAKKKICMYSLVLSCRPDQLDFLSGDLWEAGTSGVHEIEDNSGSTTLIAAFDTDFEHSRLLERFSDFTPEWRHEADVDWVAQTQRSWPPRLVGERFFLVAPWSTAQTPEGRVRLIHNPGLASGTGEHPCTRLALRALEQTVTPGCSVADIGTGSGILSIGALRLGAALAFGCDLDQTALSVAQENFKMNCLTANLIAGSADCFRESSAGVIVANIDATVLLELADELLRMLSPAGVLILTGFRQIESRTVRRIFPAFDELEEDGWICLISRGLPLPAHAIL
jgi:ribosomal protein L11 methyltransferase